MSPAGDRTPTVYAAASYCTSREEDKIQLKINTNINHSEHTYFFKYIIYLPHLITLCETVHTVSNHTVDTRSGLYI
jgi:hypothetical protein